MRILRSLSVLFALTVLPAFIFAACASDDTGDSGGAVPAAATDGGDEGTGGDSEPVAMKQTFDMGIEVTSPVFNRIRRIPKDYVCPGGAPVKGQSFEQNPEKYIGRENISPPLDWTGIPEGTQSIALIMDSDEFAHEADPDARWTHWIIWNLPPDTASLPERVATTTEVVDLGPNVRQGTNDVKTIGYTGPCPLPTTYRPVHGKVKLVFEYVFNIYALDTVLDLPGGATRAEFMQAIDGHVLSAGVIKGEFVGSKQMN